jgi:hypothetical protein
MPKKLDYHRGFVQAFDRSSESSLAMRTIGKPDFLRKTGIKRYFDIGLVIGTVVR